MIGFYRPEEPAVAVKFERGVRRRRSTGWSRSRKPSSQSIRPPRRATATASSREWAPSARRTCRTWLRTVSRPSWSVSWICDVDAPPACSWSTSVWRAVSVGATPRLQQPDDAEDAALVAESDGADVGENAPPVRVGDLELEVGRVLAVQLAEELLTGSAAVRRGGNVREVPAGDVPWKGACRRVHPPDDPLTVDGIARDPETLDRAQQVRLPRTRPATPALYLRAPGSRTSRPADLAVAGPRHDDSRPSGIAD